METKRYYKRPYQAPHYKYFSCCQRRFGVHQKPVMGESRLQALLCCQVLKPCQSSVCSQATVALSCALCMLLTHRCRSLCSRGCRGAGNTRKKEIQ